MTNVAVIDIGKTNAKLALVDLGTLTEIAVVTRPNPVLPGPPWPHFDVESHWAFLLGGLAAFHRARGVDAISVTTHGASVVLLDASGELAAPILDYEHTGPDEVAATYDTIRPDFALTGSPRLTGGLNVGAQLHWQFHVDPGLRDRTATVLTYPQFWGHRLTGVAATDVTSLGCHTDLWEPEAARFSSLARTLGIADKIAPPRPCADALGPILPAIAARTGLRTGTPVLCGIHDSNASLYPHLVDRAAAFSVVSTGTWVIVMTVGGRPVALDPARDTLINVNALGQPVPSARFMGGRDFDRLEQDRHVPPTAEDIDTVLAQRITVRSPEPFGWHPVEPPVGSGVRSAATAFALALRTSECLRMTGHAGDVVVEGPFARNACYLSMLSAATTAPVYGSPSATGTSIGAALLACPERATVSTAGTLAAPLAGAAEYIATWQRRAASPR